MWARCAVLRRPRALAVSQALCLQDGVMRHMPRSLSLPEGLNQEASCLGAGDRVGKMTGGQLTSSPFEWYPLQKIPANIRGSRSSSPRRGPHT